MARARAVETRLERQLPAVDEFFTCGFLSKEETLSLTRERTRWEYRLIAKPLLLLDVQNAVKYELGLEEQLRRYCQRTKVTLKHRWSILERIEYIYAIGVKHLKTPQEREAIRKEFVLFLKSFARTGALGKLYGQMLVSHPTRSDLWAEAALWEALERHNTDHARAIVQQALVTMAGEPPVWAAALRIELDFVDRLLHGAVETHRQESEKRAAQRRTDASAGVDAATSADAAPLSRRIRTEDEAMAQLMLDLALATTVVEESMESAAAGPALMQALLATCASYAFSKEVTGCIVHRALEKACGATRWRSGGGGLSAVLRAYLTLPDFVVNGVTTPLCSAEDYLDAEAGTPMASAGHANPAGARDAAAASLAAVLQYAALPCAVRARAAVGSGETPDSLWRLAVLEPAERLLRALQRYGAPAEGVSSIGLSLLERQSGGAAAAVPLVEALLHRDARAALRAQTKTAIQRFVTIAQELPADSAAAAGAEAEIAAQSRWPVSVFGCFLVARDRATLAAAAAVSADADAALDAPAGRPLQDDDVNTLLLWWRSEEGSAAVARADEAAETHSQLRDAVLALLQRFHLVTAGSLSTAEGRVSASRKRRRHGLAASAHPLLLPSHAVMFTDVATTPLCLWRLYSALEVVEGEQLFTARQQTRRSRSPASSSSSSSDEDESAVGPHAGGRRLRHGDNRHGGDYQESYAAAGVRFLASAAHGALSRQGQLDRAVGLSGLARSRLFSLTGVRSSALPDTTREDLLRWLATHTDAQARVEALVAFFHGLATRCQPLPRHCVTTVVLPFLEAVALAQRRAARGVPGATPAAAAAVQRARAAHESLIALYGVSQHVDDFVPLLYGTAKDDSAADASPSAARRPVHTELRASRQLVEDLNVEDWLRYLYFERAVAEDLDRARAVAERARRSTLAPQKLLMKLNNTV